MSDFPEKAKDEVNTLAVAAIGLSTTAILWASVLALQAFFMNSEGEVATQQAQNGRAAIVRGLKAEHKADLGRTTYADSKQGTLKRLDIKYAKEVVVRDAQRNRVAQRNQMTPISLIPRIDKFNSKPTIDLNGKPLQEATPAAVVPPAAGAPVAVPPAAVPATAPVVVPPATPPTAAPPTAVPAPTTP